MCSFQYGNWYLVYILDNAGKCEWFSVARFIETTWSGEVAPTTSLWAGTNVFDSFPRLIVVVLPCNKNNYEGFYGLKAVNFNSIIPTGW